MPVNTRDTPHGALKTLIRIYTIHKTLYTDILLCNCKRKQSCASPFSRVYEQFPYDSPSLSLSLSLSFFPSLSLSLSPLLFLSHLLAFLPFSLSIYLSPSISNLSLSPSLSLSLSLVSLYLQLICFSLSVFPPLPLLSLHIFSRAFRFSEAIPLSHAV